MGEKVVLQSSINECLQEIQKGYKKLASRVLKEQTLISTFFSQSLNNKDRPWISLPKVFAMCFLTLDLTENALNPYTFIP
jgi:predicted kinase